MDYSFKDVEYRISLNPGDSFPGFGTNLRRGFANEFDRWKDRIQGESREATLQPLRPHREFVARAGLLTVGLAAVTVWLGTVFGQAVLSYLARPGQIWLLVASACYLAALIWSMGFTVVWRRRWLAMRHEAKGGTYVEGYGGEAPQFDLVGEGSTAKIDEASQVLHQGL